MTYNEFTSLLRAERPEIELVTAHGGLAGGRAKTSVAVVFRPGGRIYEYRGTYSAVLDKLQVPARYRVINNGEIYPYYISLEAIECARYLRGLGGNVVTQQNCEGQWQAL